MKPCAKDRKRIAWLALGALDAQQARALRAHIETCEGCRRYLEETSEVTRALKEAQARADIGASESFHRAVARAIRAEESRSVWEAVTAPFRGARLRWRAALPALGAMAVAIAALGLLVSRFGTGNVPSPAPSSVRAVSAPGLNSELPPTLANYQLVANHSLEDLDELADPPGKQAPFPRPALQGLDFRLCRVSGHTRQMKKTKNSSSGTNTMLVFCRPGSRLALCIHGQASRSRFAGWQKPGGQWGGALLALSLGGS